MNKGDRIIIERVANGILVRADNFGGPQMLQASDIAVFNAVGGARDSGVPTLTAFIAEHFGEEAKEGRQ